MSDEPSHTSRLGVILVLLAVGGSAAGVAFWHLSGSSRNADLDTSGFDMSTAPAATMPTFRAPAPSAPEPAQQTSLGMVKADPGMSVLGSAPRAAGSSGAAKAPSNPKEEAALSLKEAAIKHEKFIDAFVRRMEAKHPSITQYGKDWAASPELRALRDQYWREKDPLKFAYGLSKSNDFGKLIKKYATNPGIRELLTTGIKEAPMSLVGAAGGVFQNDNVAKDLATTVIKALGLPASLTSFLAGGGGKVPDQSQIMSEILNSDEAKKALKDQKGSVSLDQKDLDKAKRPNGFTPLGGR